MTPVMLAQSFRRSDVALRGRDHRAADNVGMAVEKFRHRMHDVIGPERNRPLQGRRQESIVDGDFGSGGFGARAKGADVDDAHHRIARRLDQDEFRRTDERRG